MAGYNGEKTSSQRCFSVATTRLIRTQVLLNPLKQRDTGDQMPLPAVSARKKKLLAPSIHTNSTATTTHPHTCRTAAERVNSAQHVRIHDFPV